MSFSKCLPAMQESLDYSDDDGAEMLAGVLAASGVAAALPASSSDEEANVGGQNGPRRQPRHNRKHRGRKEGFVSSDSDSSTRSQLCHKADPVVSTSAFLAGGDGDRALPARGGPSAAVTPASSPASTPASASLPIAAGPQAAGLLGPAVKALRRLRPGAAAVATVADRSPAATPSVDTPTGAPQQQPPAAVATGPSPAQASCQGPSLSALPADIAERADLFALAFGDAFAVAGAGGWDPEALEWHGAGPQSDGCDDDSSSAETPDEEEGADRGSSGAEGGLGLPPPTTEGTGSNAQMGGS